MIGQRQGQREEYLGWLQSADRGELTGERCPEPKPLYHFDTVYGPDKGGVGLVRFLNGDSGKG